MTSDKDIEARLEHRETQYIQQKILVGKPFFVEYEKRSLLFVGRAIEAIGFRGVKKMSAPPIDQIYIFERIDDLPLQNATIKVGSFYGGFCLLEVW